ncbi:MAG: serine hydrolase domain-containing protein [Candidatus Dormibacteria bacterium]
MTAQLDPGLREVVEAEMERWGVPGVVVGLLRGGEPEAAAFGVASVESGDPVLPDSAFRIASVTKPFVATLVATLIQEGRINPDGPLADYVPDLKLPESGEAEITVRHLLTHTSGLDTEPPLNLTSFGNSDDAASRFAASQPPVMRWARPGRVFSYSNFGYWLLGAIAGRCTSTTFETAMRDRLLRPLGLDQTFLFAGEAITRPIAVGHRPVGPSSHVHSVVRNCYAPARVRVPSGGLISTASDLLTFASLYLGSTTSHLLDGEHLEYLMQRAAAPGWGGHYGWGWCLEELEGELVVKHDGGGAGFATTLRIVPSRDFALVVLTNSSRSVAMGHIADWAMGQFAGLNWTPPQAVPANPEVLGMDAGHYRSCTSSIQVETRGDGLKLELTDLDPLTGEAEDFTAGFAEPVGHHGYCFRDGELEGMLFDFVDLEDGADRGPSHIRIASLAQRST